MEGALLGIRLLLAAIFALAGGAKLFDLEGSRRAVAGFGVPARLAPVAGLALPLLELGIAVSLLFPPSARFGAVAALVLLLAFVAAIAAALSHDRSPDCHCFGQIHSAPVGRWTLARNSVLGVAAGFVAWSGPGPAIDTWLADRTSGELFLIAAGLAVGLCIGYAINRGLGHGTGADGWLADHSGLPIGSDAPAFELPSPCGGRLSLAALRDRGRPILLIFSTIGCEGCSELYPRLSGWQAMFADRLTIAVISVDDPSAARPLCEEHRIAHVMAGNPDVLRSYRAPGTPAAMVIGPNGQIVGGAAVGRMMIEELIRAELRRSRAVSSSAVPR